MRKFFVKIMWVFATTALYFVFGLNVSKLVLIIPSFLGMSSEILSNSVVMFFVLVLFIPNFAAWFTFSFFSKYLFSSKAKWPQFGFSEEETRTIIKNTYIVLAVLMTLIFLIQFFYGKNLS